MSSFFFAGKVYTFPIEHASTPTGPLACIYSIDLSVLQSNKSYWTARVEFLENKDPASRGKVKSRAVIRKPSREAFPDSEEAWAAGPPEFWTWTKEEILDSAPHYLRICLHSGGFLCVQFLHDMREYYSIAEFHLVTLASVEGFRLRSPDREENVWTNADFSWRKRVASEILHLPLELRAADVTEESLPCACGHCIFFQLHMRRDEASFSSSLSESKYDYFSLSVGDPQLSETSVWKVLTSWWKDCPQLSLQPSAVLQKAGPLHLWIYKTEQHACGGDIERLRELLA